MKTRSLVTCLLLLLPGIFPLLAQDAAKPPAPATPPAPAQDTGPSPLEQKLRDGLYAEEAKQDLDSAAAAYRGIVENFDRDRETAASALFRLGEVYRKQNRPKDAAECFRRVAREFPDRDPLARLARENLTALGEPLPQVPSAAAPGVADPEEDKALARLREVEKQSPDLILKPDNGLKKNGVISYDEAAEAGYIRVVQWYLEHGAAVDATPSKACPLVLAAGFGRLPLVEFLIGKGAKPAGLEKEFHQGGDYPMRAAAANGHLAVVKFLAEKGADVSGQRREYKSKDGESSVSWRSPPLVSAVSGGHRAVVELLLSLKANPDIPEYSAPVMSKSALIAAIEQDDLAMAAALLAGGASPKALMTVPPFIGKEGDRWAGKRKRLPGAGSRPAGYQGYGAEQSSQEYSAMHIAVLIGNTEMVRLLLKHNASANAGVRDPNGSKATTTPLELAVLVGREEIAALLLENGADAKHVAPGGVRIVDIAIQQRNVKFYELLRKAGATVEGTSPDGRSALSRLGGDTLPGHVDPKEKAAYAEWAIRLLNDGADPNGHKDYRPVNMAAKYRSLELIRLLKEKGADFTPEKHESDAPVPLAAWQFDSESLPVIRALLEAGADIRGVSSRKEPPTPRLVNWRVEGDMMMQVIQAMPEIAVMEEVLKLNPLPPGETAAARNYRLHARQLLSKARSTLAAQQAESTSNDAPRPHYQPDSMDPERAKEIVVTGPAVVARLWDFAFRDMNPEFGKRVWMRMAPPEKPGADDMESFRAASPNGEPLSLLDAVVYAFGQGTSGEILLLGSNGYVPIPDLSKLTLVRGGNPSAREPVDFVALLRNRDPAAMPVLKPGDIIESTALAPGLVRSWREFDKAIVEEISAMLPRPNVTVKAGTWERKFELRPWMQGFRWDPSTSVLAIEPKLSVLIRYLPKPAFCYRLNAVRIVPASGVPLTLDFSGPKPPESDPTLRDGDRIEVEAVPSDDPALLTRMKQGIFVGSEADGFLREAAHDPSTPPLEWSPEVKSQIIRRWVTESESLLPFGKAAEATVIKAEPGGAWGDVIELPAAGRDGAGAWELPSVSDAGTVWFSAGASNSSHPIRLNALKAKQTPDGMVFVAQANMGLPAFTLDRLTAFLTSEGVVRIPPVKHQWGQWSLVRDRQTIADFTPGKDAIPFVVLNSGDRLLLSIEDASNARQPFYVIKQQNGSESWGGGQIDLFPQTTRRRVTLPGPPILPH